MAGGPGLSRKGCCESKLRSSAIPWTPQVPAYCSVCRGSFQRETVVMTCEPNTPFSPQVGFCHRKHTKSSQLIPRRSPLWGATSQNISGSLWRGLWVHTQFDMGLNVQAQPYHCNSDYIKFCKYYEKKKNSCENIVNTIKLSHTIEMFPCKLRNHKMRAAIPIYICLLVPNACHTVNPPLFGDP